MNIPTREAIQRIWEGCSEEEGIDQILALFSGHIKPAEVSQQEIGMIIKEKSDRCNMRLSLVDISLLEIAIHSRIYGKKEAEPIRGI
jgi:hypothetical protein